MSETTQTRKLRRRAEIARKVRGLLGERNMSKTELGRRIGLSQSAISRRVNALEAFDIDEIERIAEVLDVSVVDLLSARPSATGRYARAPQKHTHPRGGRPPGRTSSPTGPDGSRRTSLKV
jgi:transcriptional regulator with XRE-family HTH domain